MPKFAQMFSTLRNYPSHTFQLETVDPVPASVDKQWQGKANQQREALVRHNKLVLYYLVKAEGEPKLFINSNAIFI